MITRTGTSTPRRVPAGPSVRCGLIGAATAGAVALAMAAPPSASAASMMSDQPVGRVATPDGSAGTTAKALASFQAKHGLTPTGTNDPATNQALRTASPAEVRAIYSSSLNLTGQELINARTVIGVGFGHGIPRRGIEIALMTAAQESKFVNYTTPVDHDSLGIFQQRPSTGWGTPDQITNVVLSSQSFYGVAAFGSNAGLLQIPDWQNLDRGQVAQAVQGSAYPDAYAQWQDWAIAFYDQQAGSVAPITGDTGSGGPGPGGSGTYDVDTYANASVYASPTSTAVTGTLNQGTSYVYCKAWGRQVGSGSSYNHYWLLTDPDVGPARQYVSAYYLSRWGNDGAKDNNGTVIPDC